MRNNGYKQKVDELGRLIDGIEELQDRIETLKDELKKIARRKGVKVLDGYKYSALFEKNTKTKIDTYGLYRWFLKKNMLDTLGNVIRFAIPKVGKVKGVERYIETIIDEYGKVRVVRK